MFQDSYGGSGGTLTALFACRRLSEAPARVWTFSTVVQTTTNRTLPNAPTSLVSFGLSRLRKAPTRFA